jgi:hypothetical protein
MRNITKLFKDQLDDDVIAKIAGVLGENKSGVMAAISSALPSLLLGFLKKGTEPGGADYLMQLLQERKQDEGLFNDLGSVLCGGSATADLLSSGKNLLDLIIGEKAVGIGDLIASNSGTSKRAGVSLLGMLAPIVMGLIGRTLKSQGSFNSVSLTNLLLDQKGHIKAVLPSAMTNLLGVSDLDNLGCQAVQAAAAPGKKRPWILPIVAMAAIFLLWRNCTTQEVAQKATDIAQQAASAVQETAAEVADQARDAGAAPGKFFSKKLPGGVELNIPELGVETKLLAFSEVIP